MDRKGILLDLRRNGKLKGLKPAFVVLKPSRGDIYHGGAGNFIMTEREGYLYFQKLTTIFHTLDPKSDFKINWRRFTEYRVDMSKSFSRILYLYTADDKYLEIHYQVGRKETLASEDNISRIVKILADNGVKQYKLREIDLDAE